MLPIDRILGIIKSIVSVLAVLVGLLGVGYVVDKISEPSLGAVSSPNVLERLFLRGGVEIGHRVSATTTSGTAATLLAKDLIVADYNRVLFGGAISTGADFTYTFPASSTLGSFLPNVGDNARKCWFPYGTTSNSMLLFTAGTGIDIRKASSTLATVSALGTVIGTDADNEVCFSFYRQPNAGGGLGNISAVVEHFFDAD